MNQYDEGDIVNGFVKLLMDDQLNWLKVWK